MPTRSKRLLNPKGKGILDSTGRVVTADIDKIQSDFIIPYPGSTGSGQHGCNRCCFCNADASCSYLPTFKVTIAGVTAPGGCWLYSQTNYAVNFDFSAIAPINTTFCSSWDKAGSAFASCQSFMYWMSPWLPQAYVGSYTDVPCGFCDPGPPDLYCPMGDNGYNGCPPQLPLCHCNQGCGQDSEGVFGFRGMNTTLTMQVAVKWVSDPSPPNWPVAGTYVQAFIYAYPVWYVFSSDWVLFPCRGTVTMTNNATYPDNVVFFAGEQLSGTYLPFGGTLTITDSTGTPIQ